MAVLTCRLIGAEKACVSKETANDISGLVFFKIAINIRPPTSALYDVASTGVANSRYL